MTDLRGRRPFHASMLFAAALSLGALTALPASADDDRFGGYEVRAGVLSHDTGIFSGRKEDGIDINAEVLFPSPTLLRHIGSPRPHVGGNVATNGVSYVYGGLTWDWNVSDRVYLSATFGGAVHNGEHLDPPSGGDIPGERYLGCRLLFHLAVGVGYRINERVSVQLYADHISNATLCSSNEGLENAGVRVGYRF